MSDLTHRYQCRVELEQTFEREWPFSSVWQNAGRQEVGLEGEEAEARLRWGWTQVEEDTKSSATVPRLQPRESEFLSASTMPSLRVSSSESAASVPLSTSVPHPPPDKVAGKPTDSVEDAVADIRKYNLTSTTMHLSEAPISGPRPMPWRVTPLCASPLFTRVLRAGLLNGAQATDSNAFYYWLQLAVGTPNPDFIVCSYSDPLIANSSLSPISQIVYRISLPIFPRSLPPT